MVEMAGKNVRLCHYCFISVKQHCAYDLIIKNKYKKAIEIGTSTGLSAIWFKTTIDITSRAGISISYKTAAE
jgi:hypothetical protein